MTTQLNKQFEVILNNLKFIEKSILNGTYKEQQGIIQLMIVETIIEAKALSYTVDVHNSTSKDTSHHITLYLKHVESKDGQHLLLIWRILVRNSLHVKEVQNGLYRRFSV